MVVTSRLVRAIHAVALPSLVLLLFSAGARAATPPDLPLPPCTEVNGVQQGACPLENPDLTVAAIGRFGAGASVNVMTIPMHPVCYSHNGYPPYPWSPSPCYSAVAAPHIQGCAVIDLRGGEETYREMPCSQALYKRSQDVPAPLLTTMGPGGGTSCSAAGNFPTYAYGGPFSIPEEIWSNRGPPYLECFMNFNGPRPDGLYGPTWIILTVGIDLAQDGDVRRGYARRAQVFVPVDGDLRQEGVDVSVSGSVTLDEADWDAGRLIATYTATVHNIGNERAEDVELTTPMPPMMGAIDVSDPACWLPGVQVPGPGQTPDPGISLVPGRPVNCKWPSLEINETRTVHIKVRIFNATDLHALQSGVVLQTFANQPAGMQLLLSAKDDRVSTNDEALVKVEIPFRSGSFEQTLAAMEVLYPYFNYEVAPLTFKTCNYYKDDILHRLKEIHGEHPEVFANLSYGGITSGDYYLARAQNDLTRAGHVGAVVYVKGTDYRQAGIIINGTPSPSPLPLLSEVGASGGIGSPLNWTGASGLYLRTPANKFPGTPQQEGLNMEFFEGYYPHNRTEFTFGGATPVAEEPDPMAAVTCPAPPDAVMATTESPVDIQLTNPRGQRVRTQGGILAVQELDTGIHSMAIPHEDGTFGWTLLLPKDDYEVELIGTAEGPYRLKLATFDANGQPNEFVTAGTTTPGQVDNYLLEGGNGSGSGPGPVPGPGSGLVPGPLPLPLPPSRR